jgi:hypothetical protein
LLAGDNCNGKPRYRFFTKERVYSSHASGKKELSCSPISRRK